MLIRFLILIFMCPIFHVFGQAPNEIVLSDDELGSSFGVNIGFFEDSDNQYESIDQVLGSNTNLFETSEVEIPDFNFTASRYWLRISIQNQSSFDHFILETGRPVTNKVEFFEMDGPNVHKHYESGDDFDYDVKEISHRKNLFPIDLEKGETKTFYLKLESDGELLFAPIIIYDRMSFFAQDFKDQFKNGFYFGLIALVVIIYFFFFLFLRDKTFLFYILYAFSQGMLQFSLDGYSHHHFFPKGGYLTSHSLLVFAGLTVIFLLTYVNNFLQLKTNSPSLWRVFYGARLAMGVIIVMSLVPGILYEISFPVINAASLFSVLLAAYTIIRLRLKGVDVDLFFALAFIILIIGGVVFILGNLSIVGDKIISLGALKISSALEFVVLSISMSNKYGKLQREKEEAQRVALKNLEEKNALMDQSNAMLEQQVKERTTEIRKQKEELAKSNEEIVSSIKYAKRIQQAILPSEEHVNTLLPDSFILYRPKDVVSGDFYFVESTQTTKVANSEEALKRSKPENRFIVFAAVDCTGHGVPGAFMSIVGNNLLLQSLTEPNVNSPGDALGFLNEGVNKTLRKSIDGASVRDGMDIAMCAITEDRSKLVFAGAKNPLYLVREKAKVVEESLSDAMEVIAENEALVLIQIKGDKHPIGNTLDDALHPFKDHEVNLLKGDQIYVFSDGYADQFGGERGKKFNYRRFRNLLLEINALSVEDQKARLITAFESWLGDNEQIDDVLVIGVKI